jgi:hypothetical protein
LLAQGIFRVRKEDMSRGLPAESLSPQLDSVLKHPWVAGVPISRKFPLHGRRELFSPRKEFFAFLQGRRMEELPPLSFVHFDELKSF